MLTALPFIHDSEQLNHVAPILLVKTPITVDDEPVKICTAENLLKRGVFRSFQV